MKCVNGADWSQCEKTDSWMDLEVKNSRRTSASQRACSMTEKSGNKMKDTSWTQMCIYNLSEGSPSVLTS